MSSTTTTNKWQRESRVQHGSCSHSKISSKWFLPSRMQTRERTQECHFWILVNLLRLSIHYVDSRCVCVSVYRLCTLLGASSSKQWLNVSHKPNSCCFFFHPFLLFLAVPQFFFLSLLLLRIDMESKELDSLDISALTLSYINASARLSVRAKHFQDMQFSKQ